MKLENRDAVAADHGSNEVSNFFLDPALAHELLQLEENLRLCSDDFVSELNMSGADVAE